MDHGSKEKSLRLKPIYISLKEKEVFCIQSVMYKEPRTCLCGYSTMNRGNLSKHRRLCSYVLSEEPSNDIVRILKEQLTESKQQNAEKDQQITEKDRQIAEKDRQIAELILTVTKELKDVRKRKDRYADKTSKRVHRTVPERRRIAMRQNWMCAGKECSLPAGKELEEFDIDHVIPIWLGGSEDANNLQALCPGCHRKKTDRERITSLVQTKEPILVCENLEFENSS